MLLSFMSFDLIELLVKVSLYCVNLQIGVILLIARIHPLVFLNHFSIFDIGKHNLAVSIIMQNTSIN